MDMTIIFINTYKLVEEGILGPVIEAITMAEDYAGELESTVHMYKS